MWLRRLRRARREHPSWGPRKLRWALRQRHRGPRVPSASAIGRWLKAWRLTAGKRRRPIRGPVVPRPKFPSAQRPNDVWTVDFKGWYRTGDGTKVEPLTVRDLASRYVLAISLMPVQNIDRTLEEMKRLFRQYGLPRRIRSDNGSPFGSGGALGLTRLSAWWLLLGIEVEFTEPGRPDQNGAHEQMHKVYEQEVARRPAMTVAGQQTRSNRWRRDYNERRPHEALDMRVPAKIYRSSKRRMPEEVEPWSYPAKWTSRYVKPNGEIGINGSMRYIGEAFGRQRVGLERIQNGMMHVYYGEHFLGELRDGEIGIRAVVYDHKKRSIPKPDRTPLRGSATGRYAPLRSTAKR